jgi:hypothetical protein
MGRMLNYKLLQHPGITTSEPAPVRSRHGRLATSPQNLPARSDVTSDSSEDESNVFRKLAFRAGTLMLFMRVADLPDLLYAVLHFNTYLLYVVGPPAMLGAAFTGGIGRAFRFTGSWLWLGFLGCMLLSLPFSSWVGGSVGDFKLYVLFCFPLIFTVGGLAVTWSEVRSTFTAIGAAGVVVIAAARFLGDGNTGRIELAVSGSIGNSNDLASHLIFVLPFLLYIAMDQRRSTLIRMSMIVPAAAAFWIILGTASRGALIALGVSFLFVVLRGSAKMRMAAVVAGGGLIVAVPFFLHGNAAERLASMFGGTTHEEALESQDQREYLLKQSLIYTLHHPIFGVGLGQFSNYEGLQSVGEGKAGAWHETHNCFTEVSSECGIPALICFVAGIGYAMLSVNRVYRQARKQGYPEIATACFCYLLSMVGFMVSITFLANAFRFYLSAMIGLAAILTSVAQREMSGARTQEPAALAGVPGMPAPRSRLARS